MALTLVLADKSALEQQRHSEVAASTLSALAAENRLAVCGIIALEVLYSSRGPADYELARDALDAFVWIPTEDRVIRRALTLQRRLAAEGHHRRPIPDLLVAATAIEHGATLLHYDRDFDLIAAVDDLRAEWIIPRGARHGG
ncbi:MAG: PIN domain-containing protein [Miltoncostaeaceae bacterium]